MNLNEVRETVGKIKSNLFKNSNKFAVGMLRSHFKGTGLQFKEHQVYNHGDDVRFIDWKMLAKTNTPYVKTFEEERNVEITIFIDVTPTMLSGYKGVSKLQASLEVACLIYLLAQESGDFVSVIIGLESVVYLPKSRGEEGIALLISKLERMNLLDHNGKIRVDYFEKYEPQKRWQVKDLTKYTRGRKEVVVLTDFIEGISPEELKKIFFRSHMHCFQILSPLDEKNSSFYQILSYHDVFERRPHYTSYKSEEKNLEDVNYKIKPLKVHERYLETFVKGML